MPSRVFSASAPVMDDALREETDDDMAQKRNLLQLPIWKMKL
jgi:hypothetical protein